MFTAEVTNTLSAYLTLPVSFNLCFRGRAHTITRLKHLARSPVKRLLVIYCLVIVLIYKQGDLKRYLRAQRKSDGMTPDLPTRDLLTLQRMAFEITSGLLHLHENNYIHRSAHHLDPRFVSV